MVFPSWITDSVNFPMHEVFSLQAQEKQAVNISAESWYDGKISHTGSILPVEPLGNHTV